MRWEPSDGEGRWSTTEAGGSSYHLAGCSWKGHLLYRVKTWSLFSKSFWAPLSWPWLRLRPGEQGKKLPWNLLTLQQNSASSSLNVSADLDTRVSCRFIFYIEIKKTVVCIKLIYPPKLFSTTTLVLCTVSRMESAEVPGRTQVNFFISGSISQTWTHMVGDISKDPIFKTWELHGWLHIKYGGVSKDFI